MVTKYREADHPTIDGSSSLNDIIPLLATFKPLSSAAKSC